VLAGAEGESGDCALAVAAPDEVRVASVLEYPHSLGLLCDAVRQALGVSPAEFAALADAGRPGFVDALSRELVDLKPDGSLRLDMGYFAFVARLSLGSERLSALVRTQPPADIAASTLALAGEALALMGAEARRLARADDVCVSGSLVRWPGALSALRERTPGRLFVAEGLAADAAVGAASICWSRGLKRGRVALDATTALPASDTAPGDRALPWMSAFAALAWRSLLGLLYFGALTPASLLMRLGGVEFLIERFSERGSYWKTRAVEGDGLLALRRRF
jgi:predicted NodU family carbamoyl transferase